MEKRTAEILHEFGPYPEVECVHGVTYDGSHVWLAAGKAMHAIAPSSGEVTRTVDVSADAGTAFDGRYLYQIAEGRIHKIDPASGHVVETIPAPGEGDDSGLAWSEGSLWVGQHHSRKIHQVDPETGAILQTLESDRMVTGVTWVDGEFWHGTWENDKSDVRQIDPRTGQVLMQIEMPEGSGVSGLESNGSDQFYCGGGRSGTIRVIRRPRLAPDSR
ncbi:glutamine cyclotransferase [Marinobacter halodurans]|uniref:Glutamine cyclotransferase n=1 Tax=Marinobacter halodurans TaxID=2528979 RepID=A0ABY1ZHS2_9GAMM|nr:glutamine cyclotransferase [Marinobacter halodurans]TBW53333.1 glutamine cyclotransferase [Marinobacter halodurans]